jgi:hypothetical protein
MKRLGRAARARAWWLGVALFFGASTLYAQEVEITEKARAHFRAGVNYMQDPDGARYEEAYREFRAAYAESASWKILGNLGISAMKLERDGEAIDAFKKYLAEGGDQVAPDERKQFERDLQTLEASVVTIKMVSQPPGAAFIDERIPVSGAPIANSYEASNEWVTAGIRPGHHRVTAKLAGYEDTKWEFDARPGETQEHVFEMKKPEPVVAQPGAAAGGPVAGARQTTRPIPTVVYIGAAATGALAIGAGVVGVLAMGKKSEFDDANDGSDPNGAKDIKDSGEQLNLIADVLAGGAVVVGVVTAVVFLTRPSDAVELDTGVVVRPVVGKNAGGLSLSAAF